MGILKYADIYGLAEELQQLQGAQIQGVYNPHPLRYALEVRLAGESRLLWFDLTPAQPFIVSMEFTKIKTLRKHLPIYNFLKAHFLNLTLQNFEVAQKPNRTLRLIFDGGQKEIVFKCFPHGQHLILKSEGKIVTTPLRPRDQEDETMAFVEPERVNSWELNTEIASQVLGEKVHTPAGSSETYTEKVIKKLKRAIEAIDKGSSEQKNRDEEKIKNLEREAEDLSLEKNSGSQIQNLFNEIKKLQKKESVTRQRRKDLLDQLERIQKEGVIPPSQPREEKQASKFSGTRVRISEKWELWVGRTAWQNDDLLREASSHDLWIHLRDYAGAHGVLRGPKKSEPTFSQLEFSARVVAILSQSKKSPFAEGEKLDFIVTPKKFVKKRKGDLPGRVSVEREQVRRFAFKAVKFEVI